MIYVISLKYMDLIIAQYIAQVGQGTWIDDLSFIWSREVFLSLVFAVIVGFSSLSNKKSRKQYVLALLFWGIFFYLCNEVFLKHILVDFRGLRLRPYLAYPELFHPIGNQILDSSFPSSHTAGTIMIVTLWIWRQPKLWIMGVVISILVAWSRIHNGMHYPSDVLAGAVFGILYGYLWIQASKQLIKKYFIH